VSGQHDRAATSRGAEHVGGANGAAVRQRHVLPALEGASRGTVGDAELVRGRDVEPARPPVLSQGISERGAPVPHRKRDEPVSVALDGIARRELHHPQLVGEAADHDRERVEQRFRPARTVDRDRDVAPAQRECLQHARQAEHVVGMEVGEEDVLEVDEPRV